MAKKHLYVYNYNKPIYSYHEADSYKVNTNSPTYSVEKDYTWTKGENWKHRYSKLYSSNGHVLFKEPNEDQARLSFMSNLNVPNTSLVHDYAHTFGQRKSKHEPQKSTGSESSTMLSEISSCNEDPSSSVADSVQEKRNNDTLLLDMVRARNREQEMIKKPLKLPKYEPEDDDSTIEPCPHGMSVRMTDRSMSRSRVSRMSTRRDMDIHSLLAFTTNCPAPPAETKIQAFQKINDEAHKIELPRWSIRKSMCPVCSQKWRNSGSIKVIKNSGLKKNSSIDIPTVIAPARLRASIMLNNTPRPGLSAVDEEVSVNPGGLKNITAVWQLTRARRFRLPKPRSPPGQVFVPGSSTAPLTNKDLEQRLNEFLKDEFIIPGS